ncbi:MAG: hypothetical protein GY778_09055, partial [bacterium]|nr:hypothetical protein [bacterium]
MTTTFEQDVAATLQLEAAHRRVRFAKGLGWGGLTAAVLWFTADQIGMKPLALIEGADHMWDFITRMFPPDLSYIFFLGRA